MGATNAAGRPSCVSFFLSKALVSLALIALGLAHDRATAQAPSSVPELSGQVMLIKNTLTAVNHANLSGNYTVLRDLASERFRKQYTAADLAATFANLRKQHLDLSPILITEPKLTQRPSVDEIRGRLQLVGYVPTQPQAVRFDLIFQQIQGGWVIDEISLAVAPVDSVAGPQRTPPYASPMPSPRTARQPNIPAHQGPFDR